MDGFGSFTVSYDDSVHFTGGNFGTEIVIPFTVPLEDLVLCDDAEIVVDVTTDEWPQETSWGIHNSGQQIRFVGGYNEIIDHPVVPRMPLAISLL
jgi:hypothetical protein